MELTEIFKVYNDLAVNTYHVDPKIFIFLMVLSVPFYYYGFFKFSKELLKFKKKHKESKGKLKVQDIFLEKGFMFGLTLNRLAWVMPYVYVIFWGRNIPIWFWVVFIGWIVFEVYAFWLRIKRKMD